MFRRLARIVYLVLPVVCMVSCKPTARGPQTKKQAEMTSSSSNTLSDQFLSLMNAGKNLLDQGDGGGAVETYRKAAALVPQDLDVHLNLAAAYLAAGNGDDAIREADEALKLERNSAAAYFLKGSAFLRLSNFEEAVKALENAKRIEPGVTATLFQLGVARMGMKQWEEAISAFREGIALDPNHLHATPHYLLGQSLLRAGRTAEAEKELQEHQAAAGEPGAGLGAAPFERCKYTRARVPFRLEQPAPGIKLAFVDVTQEMLGTNAQIFSGPVAVIDVKRTGWNSLLTVEKRKGFRVLRNVNGTFQAESESYAAPAAHYSKMLAGDLQNDRAEDVVVLGDEGSVVFQFRTNGMVMDVSQTSRLSGLGATDGLLMDLDFTGKLDLVAVGAKTNDVRLFRQFGPLLFSEVTSTSGVPSSLRNGRGVLMEDWNRDDQMDVIVARTEGRPLLLEKQRGGPLVPREVTNWVSGAVICSGDFNNDLRPDLAIFDGEKITVCFNNEERKEIKNVARSVHELVAIDYDNDGWLDVWAVGEKLQAWRNVGLSGFVEQSVELGLDKFNGGAVSEIHFADFDSDCDSDVVIALRDGGLRYLRNEGGNANSQIKVQLVGNRSNASGLGCKVEIETGGLRLLRTVRQLPVEVGVGAYKQLDSFLVHWFNWPQGSPEVLFDCKEPLLALEATIQEGSCPYLFAWDGKRFQFITDILGAAPLGLPVADGVYIEADPEEFVWVGNDKTFPARDGYHELRITEELREVLYLDEAKLVVVDHAQGTEVHSTDKLRPRKPFPAGELLTLHEEHPLRGAETLDGRPVISLLQAVDGRRVSPARLRAPQLRGLAEQEAIILDFGPMDASQPLVLVMNGWLRFGGGMANIAASHDPSLPFPFPVLEAEVSVGVWEKVNVTVGAPAGKTKTILVDLSGKLPRSTRRLRLAYSFEIHWDRIALFEKKPDAATTMTLISPTAADLHFRGFSAIKNPASDWPLTPEYDRSTSQSIWTIIPEGWCTRYGDVSELIRDRDEGLAMLNSGDELTLKFAVDLLPAKAPGKVRDFFLYADGWDKDSDFHVATGTAVEPLPFHGMHDQRYGREKRPEFPSDGLHQKYNTRWVEGKALRPTASARF